jgi:large subunit ribosomal protein L32e
MPEDEKTAPEKKPVAKPSPQKAAPPKANELAKAADAKTAAEKPKVTPKIIEKPPAQVAKAKTAPKKIERPAAPVVPKKVEGPAAPVAPKKVEGPVKPETVKAPSQKVERPTGLAKTPEKVPPKTAEKPQEKVTVKKKELDEDIEIVDKADDEEVEIVGEEPEEEEEEEEEEYKPKPKPELPDDERQALALKAVKRARKPKFRRQEWFRYVRIDDSWRRPRGLHSKLRRNYKYRPPKVSKGYRGPKTVRGRHPSGFEDILVHNPNDLQAMDPKRQAARIGHTVGTRKRMAIKKKADELGIRILNWGS